MIVSEIAIRVKRTFGDTANIQIDDTDIIRWVNDAMHDISLNNQLFQTSAVAATIAGTQEYSMPVDILTMRSVRYQGAKLRALSTNEAEQYIVGEVALAVTGTPINFWIWANKISLYPVPDTSDANGLTLFYTRQPTSVVLVSDQPELPLQYHNAIVQYCLQQAYELDENIPMAQAKSNQYSEGVKVLKDNVDWMERDFYPSITSTDEGIY